MDLQDKVAVVTGGADGLGRSIALSLAEHGAHVIVVDVNDEGGSAVATAIGGAFLHADVSNPSEWSKIAEYKPQVAVLNAGINIDVPDFAQLSDEDYARMRGVNLDQSVYAIRALVPFMRQQGQGRIFIVSSIGGLMPIGPPLYTLTKFALNGLVQSVAPQLAPDGITINCICPGVMDTPMSAEVVGILESMGRGEQVVRTVRIADVISRAIMGDETGKVIAYLRGDQQPFSVVSPEFDHNAANLELVGLTADPAQ